MSGPVVLVVEDDAILRKVVQRMLFRIGLQSYGASSPDDAMRVSQAMEFVALVTDIDMPEMDGITLAAKLREVHPSLPVLLMSGRPQTTTDPLLLKPFSLDALAEALTSLGVSVSRVD
jgi:DNA-binding NtrC family response regulator